MDDFLNDRGDDFGTSPAEIESSLRRVATGLALVYWSVVGTFVMMIAIFAAAMFSRGAPGNLAATMTIVGYLFWALTGLTVVGKLFCLATPEETGARGFVVGSVVFMIIATAIGLHGLLRIDLPEVVDHMSIPSHIVSAIMFLLFLRAMAGWLTAARLASKATRLLIAGAILAVLALGMMVWTLQRPQFQPGAPAGLPPGWGWTSALQIAFVVLGLYAFFTYLIVLRDLRRTILGTRPPI